MIKILLLLGVPNQQTKAKQMLTVTSLNFKVVQNILKTFRVAMQRNSVEHVINRKGVAFLRVVPKIVGGRIICLLQDARGRDLAKQLKAAIKRFNMSASIANVVQSYFASNRKFLFIRYNNAIKNNNKPLQKHLKNLLKMC